MRVTRWLEEFRHDVKFALRQMKSSPAFAAVAAMTLALGIGVNGAIFALVDATLLKPLPFPDPHRLVMIWERSDTHQRSLASPQNILSWNERSQTFDVISAYTPNVGGMVMAGIDGMSETIPRQWVLGGFFDVLGIKPIVGRTFVPSDTTDRANVVVLNETFWRTRFGGDAAIVGRDIRLDGEPYTVVGVVPPEAQVFGRTSIWGLRWINRNPAARPVYFLGAIGRLKPGMTLEAARAEMGAVAGALSQEFPATNKGRGVILEPMHDAVIGGELRRTSMLFLAVVGVVLLVCCANVANLLLARATARRRELAIRSALGAARSRVMRQLVTESLLLSIIGGALGLVVGAAILNLAPTMIPQGLLPGGVTLTFDWRVIAFCATTALLVGLLFGVAPAWQATDLSSAHVIASGSRSETGRGGRLRGMLVAGEVATAVLLLFGAGLLLRTLLVVVNVDRGYRADDVLTMIVDPIGSRYPTEASLLQFYDDVEREIRALPAVRGVAWASTLPFGPSYAGQSLFEIVGHPPVEESRRPTADYQIVSPTYFETLDLPIVAGRAFTDRDKSDTVPVCIVNEAFVRHHLQGRSPMGVRVALRPAAAPQEKPVIREIVGVARQVKGRPDETEDLLQIYVPMAQDLMDDTFLLVRPASARLQALAASVRGAIGRIDGEQLVSIRNVMTLEEILGEATSRHRFRAVLVTTFAGLALVLAMVGVFGVLAYTVQQRVRELGVRRALGATTGDVLRLVVGGAVPVVAAGLITGLGLAVLSSRLLTTMLFGVEPWDPLTFASVTILIALTVAVAIAGPAWRAARIDPATALRME